MKIRRKCEKASLGGYFLLKWLRTDCSLWNSDYSCSEEPRTLSKGSSWRQKAWPQSDPYIPKPEADISRVRRRKKHHMTRHRHSRFSLCPRQMKDWLTFAFLIIFFFASVLEKIYKKKSQEEPTWKCEVNIPVKVQRLHSLKETHSSYHHARRMRCRKILETVKNHLMKPLP